MGDSNSGEATPSAGSGFCIWFTGLPASGKSTTAQGVAERLKVLGVGVDLLDGDSLRNTVSQGIGFSRAGRDKHIRRVGSLAAEGVKNGRVVVCATISPYRSIREECRSLIGPDRFVEVFMDTPVEVCERRDPKGLYARARRGEILNFTGVSDPYEPPETPELSLDTVHSSIERNVDRIVSRLVHRKLVPWR